MFKRGGSRDGGGVEEAMGRGVRERGRRTPRVAPEKYGFPYAFLWLYLSTSCPSWTRLHWFIENEIAFKMCRTSLKSLISSKDLFWLLTISTHDKLVLLTKH